MNTYRIYRNGVAYGGEHPTEYEEAPAPAFAGGWTGHGPTERGKLLWGRPCEIQGKRNLRGHIQRILDRDLLQPGDVLTIECIE